MKNLNIDKNKSNLTNFTELHNQEKLNNDNGKENKPDDNAGFYLRNFLKIYDPDSGNVAVETSN